MAEHYRRVDLHTQTPDEDMSPEEAEQAQNLRDDAKAFFRSFGDKQSK